MVRNKYLLGCLLFFAQIALAQDGRYAIYFSDKTGTSFSTNTPLEFLSQKSLDRRNKNGVTITEEDFPPNEDYVSQVKGLGADILYTSRWMNAVVAQLEGSELVNVMALPFVVSTEYVGPNKSTSGGRVKHINQKKDSKLELVNQTQNAMLGLNEMHEDKILGEGIVVGVFDSGFPGVNITEPFKLLFSEGRVSYTLDLVGKSSNVYQYDDHGTEVLSIMAANYMPSYVGGIPNATYQLYVTEDVGSEFRIEEYNWLVAAEKADSAGVDIINSSLGYNLFDDSSMDYTTDQLDGKTALISKAASIATSKGMLVVVSAGNDGNTSWKLLNPPADADGVIAVGAITSTGNVSNFSSVGPSTDGRIKPEVVALGSGVSIIKSNGTTGFTSGTSSAAPLVTSLAAGLLQRYPLLTATELYNLIILSGSMQESPDNMRGYGIPNYSTAKQIQDGEPPTPPTSEIYMYPNPVTEDILKVELNILPGKMATIYIYNLQGQLMMKSDGVVDYSNNPVELNLSAFATGIYVVKVQTEDSIETIRLVKL